VLLIACSHRRHGQDSLVRVGGVNKIGDKTVLSLSSSFQ